MLDPTSPLWTSDSPGPHLLLLGPTSSTWSTSSRLATPPSLVHLPGLVHLPCWSGTSRCPPHPALVQLSGLVRPPPAGPPHPACPPPPPPPPAWFTSRLVRSPLCPTSPALPISNLVHLRRLVRHPTGLVRPPPGLVRPSPGLVRPRPACPISPPTWSDSPPGLDLRLGLVLPGLVHLLRFGRTSLGSDLLRAWSDLPPAWSDLPASLGPTSSCLVHLHRLVRPPGWSDLALSTSRAWFGLPSGLFLTPAGPPGLLFYALLLGPTSPQFVHLRPLVHLLRDWFDSSGLSGSSPDWSDLSVWFHLPRLGPTAWLGPLPRLVSPLLGPHSTCLVLTSHRRVQLPCLVRPPRLVHLHRLGRPLPLGLTLTCLGPTSCLVHPSGLVDPPAAWSSSMLDPPRLLLIDLRLAWSDLLPGLVHLASLGPPPRLVRDSSAWPRLTPPCPTLPAWSTSSRLVHLLAWPDHSLGTPHLGSSTSLALDHSLALVHLLRIWSDIRPAWSDLPSAWSDLLRAWSDLRPAGPTSRPTSSSVCRLTPLSTSSGLVHLPRLVRTSPRLSTSCL
ncbi:hypothetical protein FNV43_RR07202 [Rhamnella rubrinervis]|uniref:Uncharacterized protein n=1 Tax=Rhamnella rubrinervis TaxID=2594499 RepID=A0A8K0HFD9_9ROSA|nr:hypothetical protein FNV43_RR07202 [Rhamnella rubrinervis]